MERLREFVLEEVLSSNATTKLQVLLGRIGDEKCLIKLSRLALPELSGPTKLPIQSLQALDTNGIYSWGTGSLAESGTCYFDVVFPATEQHIAKYREATRHVMRETGTQYHQLVKPWIEEQRGTRLDWVRAILDHGAEADRVVFRDKDFVLLPNSKWDRKTVDSLYLLALVESRDIGSIRDLRAEHIPLLEHIRDTSCREAEQKWGLPASQIKCYFHYPPSYYHLHVHVANVALDQQDFGKSVLLDDVVERLKLGVAMQDTTLTYFIADNTEIYWRLTQ